MKYISDLKTNKRWKSIFLLPTSMLGEGLPDMSRGGH